jgi:hypothetical protein
MLTDKELYDQIRQSSALGEMMKMTSRAEIIARLHQIAADAGRDDLTPDVIDAQLDQQLATMLDANAKDDCLTDDELELVAAGSQAYDGYTSPANRKR